jgi:hypothetical protein
MTQISRPFQIVLVAFVLFVGVWLLALHGHTSTSTGGSGSSASGSSAPASSPTPTPSTATTAKTDASSRTVGSVHTTRVTHVSHGASTVTVKHPTSTSTTAGHGAATHATVVAKHTTAATAAKPTTHTTVVHTTTVTHTSTTKPAPKTTAAATGTPAQQATVEHQLQQGKTVLILFWNPRGSDDVAVHKELPAVQHALGGKIAVDYASASQVGSYGSVTHAIQITQTPTLLIVNPHGQTTVLTGLTDAFAIEQTVGEAQ